MIWILYGMLCIFQILDATQTWMLISLGVDEGNPLVALLIEKLGYWQGVILLKVSVMVFIGFVVYRYEKLKGNK